MITSWMSQWCWVGRAALSSRSRSAAPSASYLVTSCICEWSGHSLVFQRTHDAVPELRGLGSKVVRSRSLVEELLKDRRLAAAAGE